MFMRQDKEEEVQKMMNRIAMLESKEQQIKTAVVNN